MMRHRIIAPVVAAAVTLGLGACAKSTDEAATTTKAEATTTKADTAAIEVKDQWARATIGEATSTGVFMTIDNSGSGDDALVGASVPTTVARVAQLHETVASTGDTSTTMQHGGSTTMSMDGNGSGSGQMGSMAGMQEVQQIDVPAGSSVQLKPGGYHVMLIDLAKPLAVGDTFELTLTFENAGTRTVNVTAKES